MQAAELWTGNIPAEFGAKVSGVVVITSRSGLGTGRPLTGDVSIAAGGFDTWHGAAQGGGQRGRLAYFGSATAMRTSRFLDQVSLDNLHNDGHFGRGFLRADVRLADGRQWRAHLMGGQSRFELANLRSQQRNGQDQRQRLGDLAGWTGYSTTIGAVSTLELVAGRRVTNAALVPSAGDTPVTAAQDRRMATTTLTTRLTRLFGRHHLRAGADIVGFTAREFFRMGITHPAFNAPDTSGYNPALTPHDLTRGGAPFVFDARRTGTHLGAFAHLQLHAGSTTLSLGTRVDRYRLLVRDHQWQPRLGIAWAPGDTFGVLRASSYNFQTPPLENLLLSSSPRPPRSLPTVSARRRRRVAADSPRAPARPRGRAQRGLGGVASLDVSLYWKQSRGQQDNNNFFDTGIIFPTTLARIDVRGAEARLVFPERRRVSGTIAVTTSRALSTPPFTGGLFLGQDAIDLLSAGPFYIDHDQRLSVHGTAQYRGPAGWWASLSTRYDSGLVANPSDPAEVAADPDFADLLPYVDLDATVARVRPRTIVDVATGLDLRRAGRRVATLQLQVTNLTNRVALYNFQSVFVGTRLVQPRTMALRVKWHF